MRVLVLSRQEAEDKATIEAKATEPYFAISFHGKGDLATQLVQHPNLKSALLIEADDSGTGIYGAKVFTQEQAALIAGFAELAHNEGINLIMVNCFAGISRSSACAAAIMLKFNGDDSPIFNSYSYMPNAHIYTLMRRAFKIDLFSKYKDNIEL